MFIVQKVKWINYSKELTTIALLFNLEKNLSFQWKINEKYLYSIITTQVGKLIFLSFYHFCLGPKTPALYFFINL